MSLASRTILSRTLLAGFVLSLVGAKGCLGGDVSLGYYGTAGASGLAGTGNAMTSSAGASSIAGSTAAGGASPIGAPCALPLDPAPCAGFSLGYSFDPQAGKCVARCSNSANFSSLEACQATCEPGAGNGGAGNGGAGGGASATEAPLAVDANGHVTSSAALGVSGPFYRVSDGVGLDGTSATGDCELAGHSEAQCAQVTTPPDSAPGVANWSIAGLLCTSGTVEGLLEIPGMSGMIDYAHMWGAGVAFNLLESNPNKQPYDASAHGVIGVAFDIDRVPSRGLRVELLTPASVSAPPAWKPFPNSSGYASPVQVGHNVVLFQDVAPLPVYQTQIAFDPTELLSVQFHVPTTNIAADYAFCITNLALVLGTPPARTDPVNGACPPSLETDSGFAYNAAGACVSPYSTVLGCSTLDNPATVDPTTVIPSAPVVANLPCVHHLSDGALFIALNASTQPLAWQTLPRSAWSHLSPTEWAECSADEAALVAAAPVCPILPI